MNAAIAWACVITHAALNPPPTLPEEFRHFYNTSGSVFQIFEPENKDQTSQNTHMNLWVARAVPYAANILKDALVALSVDKKKAQDALVVLKKISSSQWASIFLIIFLILGNLFFIPTMPPQWLSPLKNFYYQRVTILLLSVLPWMIIPHKMNWRQANRRATLTVSALFNTCVNRYLIFTRFA